MPWSTRASISPITERGLSSRASISLWRSPLTRRPARSICSRRRLRRVLLSPDLLTGSMRPQKRKADANGDDYEPTLTAATKNLGDWGRNRESATTVALVSRLEAEGEAVQPILYDKTLRVKGSGLGLSAGHDIIVKQHGGSDFEVDTPNRRSSTRVQNRSKPRQAATAAVRVGRTVVNLLILVVDDGRAGRGRFCSGSSFVAIYARADSRWNSAQSADLALPGLIAGAGDQSLILILSDINSDGGVRRLHGIV